MNDKKIDTLIDDINNVLEDGVSEELVEKYLDDFSSNVRFSLKKQFVPREDRKPELYLSGIGQPCGRKLWYTINHPNDDKREKLRGQVKTKFIFGDLTEEIILLAAKIAGHKVEGQQDSISIVGVRGRMDAIIDGHVVDVKSASSFAMKKFQKNLLSNKEEDPFGYFIQLMSYLYGSQEDDRVKDKDTASFLAFDKQGGSIVLDTYKKPSYFDKIPEMFERRKSMVNDKTLPERAFEPVPDGKSGNMKLPTNCSYCSEKHLCHDNIRTFLSSYGPLYLTTVAREPRMMEMKYENGVYEANDDS